MVSQRELPRIVPAHLIGSSSQLLVERTHQSAIDIDVKFAERETAFVDQTEGLSRKRECDCRTILDCFLVGTTISFCRGYGLPASGVHKSTVLVVNGFGRGCRYRCIRCGRNDQRWSGRAHLCSGRCWSGCTADERSQYVQRTAAPFLH